MSQQLVFLIYYLSVFYLDLYVFISFLELFYFNCKLFNFRKKYYKDLVLEQKKGDFELIRVKNIKILCKNIRHGRAKQRCGHAIKV